MNGLPRTPWTPNDHQRSGACPEGLSCYSFFFGNNGPVHGRATHLKPVLAGALQRASADTPVCFGGSTRSRRYRAVTLVGGDVCV